MTRALLLCLLAFISVPALAMYRCESGGTITYSDMPCVGGTPFDAGGRTAADTAAARQQSLLEQRKLRRIENERHKHEAQEEKERQRAAHAAAAKHKRCAALARRKQWAEQDATATVGKASQRAKRKAHRVGEQFDEECGTQKAMSSS